MRKSFNKKNLNLPAFTLIELIFTLILTSIVIGLTTMVYYNVEKMYRLFVKRSEATAELERLHYVIQYDLERGNKILKTEEGFECIMNDFVVDYQFTQDFIIRTKERE